MCRSRGGVVHLENVDVVDSGTFTIADDSSLNVRRDFPESWIWLSIDVTNDKGYETEYNIRLSHYNLLLL